ncbi:MAG TPA: aldolase, partial [Stellaceae bacterium]|nr:aldolase [Stellaceae bacterium]
NDLCAELGIHGDFTNPRVVDAYRAVVAACAKHGKHAGVGGVYTEDLLTRYVGMGCRFVLAGQDGGFLLAAAQQRSAFLRALRD